MQIARYTGPIVDAHHHVWRVADLPWLAGPMQPRIFGEYAAIRRDYPIEEFVEEARAAGVVRSVYVQANWPNDRALAEVAWVQSLGDAPGPAAGWPHAIVGFADLADPQVGRLLDAQLAHSRLRGIRQQLHWHEKPLYRFAGRPDLADDPAWRRGLAEVSRRGLVFELQVFTGQREVAERLVRDFPEVAFVLEHAGMLEDRSPEGLVEWRRLLVTLGRYPNVHTKLSGLGTFLRACDAHAWRVCVEQALDAFTPQRCLFGSNFPIEKLWTRYGTLVDTMRDLLAPLGERDARAVFHDNAVRLYRLG